MTCIASPWARCATSLPTLPRPMMPSVLLRTSTPRKRFFSHLPAFILLLAEGTCLASAISMAIVCSATAMILPVGEFTTMMPRRVAASISMLSTPTPARPTILRCCAAARMPAVTCVSLRTIRAVYSSMRASSCSGVRPVCMSICASGSSWRSRSMPSSAIRSATRIRIRFFSLLCASSITALPLYYSPCNLLLLKTELAHALFKDIHGFYQVYFLEKAQVAHAENLALQVLLPAPKNPTGFLAPLFNQDLSVDPFVHQHRR